MNGLKGKVAIVTGAARGIGQATGQALAREGVSVAIADIDEEGAEKVARDINKSGSKALAVKTDISNEDQVNQMVAKTIAKFGRVDILVNNAGLLGSTASYKGFSETEVSEWRREIGISLIGTLLCCKAVIDFMLQQKSGRIISVSSDAGKFGVANQPIYSAVKAGIAGFSRALALDVATKGITVNCVSPGAIRTPGLKEAIEKMRSDEEGWKSMTPMGRLGEPEEIASMIVFLASDQASFITGQDYSVDGGIRM